MSLESTLQRIAAIDRALADPAALIQGRGVSAPRTAAATGGTAAPASAATATPAVGTGSFAAALQQASAPSTPTPTTGTGSIPVTLSPIPGLGGSSTAGIPITAATGAASGTQAPASISATAEAQARARIVSIAEGQIGQAEQPPGSNESPAISTYRSATAGAIPGAPWCAYFASWVARQAGAPIGSQGQGLGAVADIWSWAQSTGRAIPNGPGVTPQPGDLIVFGDQHVGIVRAVLPNGQIETVEGNYENKVAANVRTPAEATGYVRMG